MAATSTTFLWATLSKILGIKPCAQSKNSEITLRTISFNKDFRWFVSATDRGYTIYKSYPSLNAFRTDLNNVKIGIVEMLSNGTNIFAFVGSDRNSEYPPNKVVLIWDGYEGRCVRKLTFDSSVRAVKLRLDALVVVLEDKICIYSFPNFKVLHVLETSANPNGLCVVSHHSDSFVLACPDKQHGNVCVKNYCLKKTIVISAHNSEIACLALTLNGEFLATASSKGTVIRIFNILDGTCVREFRRGSERAEVYSIAFSSRAKWLAVSSDKGTTHVFALKLQGGSAGEVSNAANKNAVKQLSVGCSEENQNPSPSSSLGFMKDALRKYFIPEKSFAKFHLDEKTRFLVGFEAENTIAIVGLNGSFHRCKFDPINGGEMVQTEHHNFLFLTVGAKS